MSSFTDPNDARLFATLIHDETGFFPNVQTPSVEIIGARGIIDEDSVSFQTKGILENVGEIIITEAQDYIFCSSGVSVTSFS